MRELDRHLHQMHSPWEKCRTRYLVVVVGVPCLESQSSHGRVEDPNSVGAAEGTETAGDQLVERTRQPKKTASAGVREEARNLTLKLKHHSQVAGALAVLDTSQLVDQVKRSVRYLIEGAVAVVNFRRKNWVQSARRP